MLSDPLGDPRPEEECGVFGVWAPGEEVSKLTFYGMFALQHRGQQSAGIAVSDGDRIMVFKDMGLVPQVPTSDAQLTTGHIALRTRYSSWRPPSGRTPNRRTVPPQRVGLHLPTTGTSPTTTSCRSG